MPVARSDDIIPGLVTAASLDSIRTAQTEQTLMSSFVQVWNELAIFNNFSDLSLAIYHHSLSLVLKDT